MEFRIKRKFDLYEAKPYWIVQKRTLWFFWTVFGRSVDRGIPLIEYKIFWERQLAEIYMNQLLEQRDNGKKR